jgi:hypothetical protein
MEQEETVIVRQRLCKHGLTARHTHATIEELLEAMISMNPCRSYTERTVGNCLFKSGRLSASIKLTLHKALIRSVMTYAFPACELGTDTYLLKLQHLQNNGFHTIKKFPRFTPVRDLHTAYNLCMRLYKNCSGYKPKSYKIVRMKMFVAQDKAKPNKKTQKA